MLLLGMDGKDTTMTVSKLKEILDGQFCPPYLAEGMVSTRWVDTSKGRVLEVKIDRRDVWLDEDGDVVGSGTTVIKPPCMHNDLINRPEKVKE